MRQTLAIAIAAALVVPAVADAGFRVSSYKKETKLGANYWNVASALDGDPETCWMVDPEKENVGEWIEIDVPRSTIDKLSFVSGWGKSDDTFADYARVKKAHVTIYKEDDGDEIALEQDVTLEDKNGWQDIDLPDTEVGGEYTGGRVRIEITEVFEGKDYPALGVSEVLVRLAEKEAPIKIVDAPTSEVSGHDGMAMIDGKTSSYWLSESNSEQSFSVGAMDFGIARMGITAGPAKYARPKSLTIKQGLHTTKISLENTDKMQWVDIPPTIGFTGSAWGTLKVEITDVYAGTAEGVAIGEVQLKSTNFDG